MVVLGANLYLHFSFDSTFEENRANYLDRLFGRLLVPLQVTIDSAESFATNTASGLKNLYRAEKENADLRAERDRLLLNLQELAELKSENAKLRDLLDFREKESFKFISAKVVARDPSLVFRSLEIDRGSDDGVHESMAVVAPAGVVGRVIEAFPSTSTVLLITDVNSRLEALVQRSRTRTLVGGSSEGELTLRFLPRRHDVRQGDELVTSGIGDFFPPGFKIGTIVGLAQDPNLVLQQAQLEPMVDFDSLGEVFVVQRADKPQNQRKTKS